MNTNRLSLLGLLCGVLSLASASIEIAYAGSGAPNPGTTGQTGPAGPTGATGPAGATGAGVAAGGTTGQILYKTSGTDYATAWETQPGVYTVGTQAMGGIVFFVDSTGTHGLVAALADAGEGTTYTWDGGNGDSFYDFVTGATGDGIGAGQMNTSLIVSEQELNATLVHCTVNARQPPPTVIPTCTAAPATLKSYAANICTNYSIQADGTTACAALGTSGEPCYADWYLPSKYELNQMYLEQSTIGGFTNVRYWSSTEDDASLAWSQIFYASGNPSQYYKSNFNNVRCVRAF